MGERSDLPPRLRNWKKGHAQIGAFIRTRQGATISLVNDSANEDQEALVLALIMGTKKIPPEILTGLRKWLASHVKWEEL